MEPEADGWVIKRGACSSLPETVPMTEKKKKERLWLDVIQIALRHGFGQMMTTDFFFSLWERRTSSPIIFFKYLVIGSQKTKYLEMFSLEHIYIHLKYVFPQTPGKTA